MLNTKFAPWPKFEEDEVQAVQEVLRSGKVNYWTGDHTKKFESEFAKYHQRNYGIALANGTLALELALIGFGIGPGDEVITTPRTFIASASCIVRVGAIPVLADVDPISQNICVETIQKKLSNKTKAIIVVHLGGWPADMPAIMKFADANGLIVVEDCSQAHGAKFSNQLVGSWGHAAAFSFCQDKIMSTGGEGGILILDDENVYKKMWAFKDHGKDFDAVYNRQHPPGFRWLHESFGTNWRMTEIQAVIGRIQLGKLESWVQQRRVIAQQMFDKLSSLPEVEIYQPAEGIYHSYYRFYFFLKGERGSVHLKRNEFLQQMSSEGIPCFVGSCGEIYKEKAFMNSSYKVTTPLENASRISETSIALLVHPGLDLHYSEAVGQAARKSLEKVYNK